MVQKYIAVLLVLTTLGLTSPCLAGDFANLSPLMQTRLASLTPHRATLGSMAGASRLLRPSPASPANLRRTLVQVGQIRSVRLRQIPVVGS